MAAMKEVQIASRRIHEGRVINLRVDEVELSDGRRAVREVIEHPGAVVVAPILDDRTVLMVRQYRYPTGKTLLELPAGSLSAGEPPDDCAQRELAEETGYRAGCMERLGQFYSAPGFCSELLVAYLAMDLSPHAAQGDEDEVIEVERVDLNGLIEHIRMGEIEDAKSIACLWLALERLR